MSTYLSDVRRFGAFQPYVKDDRKAYYLNHRQTFEPHAVETDGFGNVIKQPLLRRKDCFGRLERAVRGGLERGTPYGPFDDYGEQERGETKCMRCPVFDACMKVADERLNSSPIIRTAFEAWWSRCRATARAIGCNECFVGARRRLWEDFLDAIENHGGWSSVNDDQIRLDDMQRKADANRKRREKRAATRKKEKLERKLGAEPLSPDFMNALDVECRRRAHDLRRLRTFDSAPRWIKRLPDTSCDRIANVWWAMQILKREGGEAQGKKIVEVLIAYGRDGGCKHSTLHTRVCEDVRLRLPKLEEDLGHDSIWSQWSPPTP